MGFSGGRVDPNIFQCVCWRGMKEIGGDEEKVNKGSMFGGDGEKVHEGSVFGGGGLVGIQGCCARYKCR